MFITKIQFLRRNSGFRIAGHIFSILKLWSFFAQRFHHTNVMCSVKCSCNGMELVWVTGWFQVVWLNHTALLWWHNGYKCILSGLHLHVGFSSGEGGGGDRTAVEEFDNCRRERNVECSPAVRYSHYSYWLWIFNSYPCIAYARVMVVNLLCVRTWSHFEYNFHPVFSWIFECLWAPKLQLPTEVYYCFILLFWSSLILEYFKKWQKVTWAYWRLAKLFESTFSIA